MNASRAVSATLVALLVGCSNNPESILDSCALPEPCGPLDASRSDDDLTPHADAACAHAALESGGPAHLTASSRGIGTITWDLYIGQTGLAVLLTKDCKSDDSCTEEVGKCTLRLVEEITCTGGCAPPEDCAIPRVCYDPGAWCVRVDPTDAACP